jgi:hypothetical protein
MDIELSGLPLEIRKDLRPKMRRYKSDLDDLRKRFLRAEEDLMDQKNKENILGGAAELSENHKAVLI